jgi:hypothetical protein
MKSKRSKSLSMIVPSPPPASSNKQLLSNLSSMLVMGIYVNIKGASVPRHMF